MTIEEKVSSFTAAHRRCTPLRLVNAWDAGSARAVAEAGAAAVATSSWAVAAAAGLEDAEILPLADAIETARSIVRAVDLPVTADFEGGYAEAPAEVAANARTLLETGVVGCNFEDRVVRGTGLHAVEDQAARVRAISEAAESLGRPVFINARTDLFLLNPPESHAEHVAEALARAEAYARAGAAGLFVPGLADPALVARICSASHLPINIMVLDIDADLAPLAAAGVARISFGPAPYLAAMGALTEVAGRVLGR